MLLQDIIIKVYINHENSFLRASKRKKAQREETPKEDQLGQ